MATIVASKTGTKHVSATPPIIGDKQGEKNEFSKPPAKKARVSEKTSNSLVIQSDEEVFNELVTIMKHNVISFLKDKLQSYGINASDINKFKAAGYCTVLSVIQATKKELSQVKGISEAKVEKVLEAATKIEIVNNFMTGCQLLQKRTILLKITTGSSQFDNMLGGGFESMSLTEIFGENRTGKTQICHTICVTAQLPLDMLGGNGKVCFIDTEGTFRPEKIHNISSRFGLTGESAYTHEHLFHLLNVAAAKVRFKFVYKFRQMVEDHFSLLIIDSIMALFRVDFTGRGELADRQQMLGKTLSKLAKIADQFNISVVYTNHVMSDPAGGLSFIPNPSKPIGGHVLGHASTTRLSLRKGKGEQRVCKVYDSPCLPESECVFQLSDQGVIDVVD